MSIERREDAVRDVRKCTAKGEAAGVPGEPLG